MATVNSTPQPLLSVRDLTVRYGDGGFSRHPRSLLSGGGAGAAVVDGLSFDLFPGEALAMVGESGSGKSQTWLAALGLLDAGAAQGASAVSVEGGVSYRGRDLLTLPRRQLDRLRGRDIALIFQDPMTALNPSMRLAVQLTEAPRRHRGLPAAEARRRAADMLRTVGVPDAAHRLRAYPHELSGGLRQRAAFAMALLCEPKILIADEPTTALDATVQAQILRLLAELRREFQLTLAIVTHDLGVVAALCDRMLVMYGGREMESGPVAEVFAAPRHPYTAGLLASTPRIDRAHPGVKLRMIPGAPPAPGELPAESCPFAPRCSRRIDICDTQRPQLQTVAPNWKVACHLHNAESPHPVIPEGRETRSASDYVSRLSGISRLKRDAAKNDRARLTDCGRDGGGDCGGDGSGNCGVAVMTPAQQTAGVTGKELLSVENLTVAYRIRVGLFASKPLRALTAVSFTLNAGETLSVVGESGCGKSTLARAVLRLLAPQEETAGRVTLAGEELSNLPPEALRARRRALQMVFQDPLASLNPRMTAGRIVAEPLGVAAPDLTAAERMRRAVDMLAQTGLPAAAAQRYPHEFSGGQAQRIGIARALITRPRLLVCDEPVSALDVSVQAQILNLLADLRTGGKLALLFITHDLSVARAVSDRVLVLYLGRIMEIAPAAELFAAPRHPYTQGLLASAPPPTPQAARNWQPPLLTGEPPSPMSPPSGCVFRRRCPRATPECAAQVPELETTDDGRQVACLRWRDPPRHSGR